MKKYFLLSALCAMATLLPAQTRMYVWQGDSSTEFAISEVDSITFDVPASEPVLPEGALPGLFSVGADTQVRFSCGNLQYTQSTETWAFAANQYDIIGAANVDNGALADKIDLFGWSADAGAATWGVSTSYTNSDYVGNFVDWGKNAIANGGQQADLWRTLTNDEWEYLLKNRPDAISLQGVAAIDGIGGLVLLPDDWQQPEGASFTSGFSNDSGNSAFADYQSFTVDEWQILEKAGAVFLPASGYRSGTTVDNIGYYGYAWSATPEEAFWGESTEAYYMRLNPNGATTYSDSRRDALPVRLVQDVE